MNKDKKRGGMMERKEGNNERKETNSR